MRDFKPSLSVLKLFALLALVRTGKCSSIFGPTNEYSIGKSIPDIHHSQALQLCQKLNKTRIPHAPMYLWAFIHPEKEHHSLEKRDAPKTENPLTVSPACAVYKQRFCGGKTRFPLADQCEFFQVIPQSMESCGELSNNVKVSQTEKYEEEPVRNQEVGREVNKGQRPITMSHAQATDLCLMVNQMPVDQKEPAQVKFTPIRLELDVRATNHIAKRCVLWEFNPCKNDESKSIDTKTCGQWNLVISEKGECATYAPILAKLLQKPAPLASGYKNYTVERATHFFESPPGKNVVETSNEDEDMMSVSDLVHCQRLGNSVNCTISPPPSLRSKRTPQLFHVQRHDVYGNRRDDCDCGTFLTLLDV